MDTLPSRPVTREKPVPVASRRLVRVFIIASLLGLGLGVISGIAAGFMSLLVGNVQNPYLGLTLLALQLGAIIVFPIAGLCTGLVTATQRSAERGSVVGAFVLVGLNSFCMSHQSPNFGWRWHWSS
jgi:hypothetical protein